MVAADWVFSRLRGGDVDLCSLDDMCTCVESTPGRCRFGKRDKAEAAERVGNVHVGDNAVHREVVQQVVTRDAVCQATDKELLRKVELTLKKKKERKTEGVGKATTTILV